MLIRRAQPYEIDEIRTLVQCVVDEVYAGLWADPPVPIDDEDWSLAWVCVVEDVMAGIILTHTEWLSDLWVLKEYRGRGIGEHLCAQPSGKLQSGDTGDLDSAW